MKEGQRARLELLCRSNPAVRVLDFVTNAEQFIAQAAAIVSMAGYNSVCEILTADVATLLVPRTAPRAEQLVRARRLADRGLVDLVQPEEADASTLSSWLAAAVVEVAGQRRPVDLDGLRRVPELAADLCGELAHAV
jgi:predicted glycosyltransferase